MSEAVAVLWYPHGYGPPTRLTPGVTACVTSPHWARLVLVGARLPPICPGDGLAVGGAWGRVAHAIPGTGGMTVVVRMGA